MRKYENEQMVNEQIVNVFMENLVIAILKVVITLIAMLPALFCLAVTAILG